MAILLSATNGLSTKASLIAKVGARLRASRPSIEAMRQNNLTALYPVAQ